MVWSRDLRTEGLDQLRVDVFSERFARWIVPAELGRAAAVGGMPDGGVHVLMAPLALHWCALALTVFVPASCISTRAALVRLCPRLSMTKTTTRTET